jgi:serine/threonine protein kinase
MSDLTVDHIDIGTVVGDTYEVTRLIGRGATSVVWAARHRRLPEKEVAIKVLLFAADRHSEAYARLRHEAEIISRLNHPNIVQILDFDELPAGTPYMVLELLRGETLRERLRQGRLALDRALEIATQIGSALSAAHHHGVVHRDLKPGNVFLSPTVPPGTVSDHVKVLDFGLSRMQGATTLSTLSGLGGTPQYMAPEQWTGSVPTDARADIFAFGAVLYEMLAGRPAFKGESVPEVAMQVVYRAPEPIRHLLPDLPAAVADAVERALEKDRERRFATVPAFLAALGSALPPGPAATVRHATPRVRPRAWRIAGAVFLVVFGLLFLTVPAKLLLHRLSVREAAAPEPPPSAADKIAVMEFENQRRNDPENDWYCKALQTAVNTEFSKISQISVVAPEETHRTEIEVGDRITAARQLKVGRFITGSFAVVGNAMRIDARIVETTNGMQEAAEKVEGSQDQFFALEKQIALAMLERFQVRLTQAQKASLTKPTNAPVDKYRMLLDAEGVTHRETAPTSSAPGPQSRAHSLPNDAPGDTWSLARLFASAAYAQGADAEEQAARRVLDEYRAAHERGDLDQLAALYVVFPESQRRAIAEYKKNIEDLHVRLTDVKIQPREHDIMVSYTRHDNFVDKETRETMSLEVHLTRFLVQDGGQWKFAAEE